MSVTEYRGLVARIEAEMAARGLSAYALARLAGVGLATMSRTLAGQGDPSWKTVQKLALALGLSTDDLRDPGLSLVESEPVRPRGRPRKPAAE